MIEFKMVSRSYPGNIKALKEIELSVREGQTMVLLGEEGSGKSTIVRIAAGLLKPTSGTVLVADEDVVASGAVDYRKKIGYVISGGGLIPHMSVYSNISAMPGFKDWEADKKRERIGKILGEVGLDPDRMRKIGPRDLSAPEVMQASMARALAFKPSLVLLDEPFLELDRPDRDRMRRDFLRIRALHRRITFIYATRDAVEAVKVGDYIAVMKEGELLQVGSASGLNTGTRHPYVARIFKQHDFRIKLEAVNLSDLMIEHPIHITTTQLKLPVSRAVHLMKKNRISSLVVTSPNYEFKGIVSLDDIQETERESRIRDVVRSNLVPLRTTDSFSDALSYFTERDAEFLPVIDEHDRLKGLITRKGISNALEKLL